MDELRKYVPPLAEPVSFLALMALCYEDDPFAYDLKYASGGDGIQLPDDNFDEGDGGIHLPDDPF